MKETSLPIDISEIASKLDLKESQVLKTLEFIASNEEGVVKQTLLWSTGMPETHLGRLLRELSPILKPVSDKIAIKKEELEGIKKVVAEANDYEGRLQDILRILGDYRDVRPKPDRKFDQFTATDETTARRAILMAENGDLMGRNIVFLGDDDLTSVAVAVLGQAQRITVFEVDPRLIGLINEIAKKEGLRIETVEHDLRDPLSRANLGKFDTVFTDPPYTSSGIGLFLNRAIESIRPKLTSRIYFCYGQSDRAREREIEIQRILAERGLVVNTKLYGFNKYFGAESIGSSSSLYICDWTPRTHGVRMVGDRLYSSGSNHCLTP